MSSSSEENEESKGTISLNYTNSDEESLLGEEPYEPDLVNDQENPTSTIMEGTTPSCKVSRFFLAKLRPQMLNLMNEFADAEMFLIDADSLFMEFLLDRNLDWCYGGQLLHLVYLFERYLHLFVRKGGVFQLLFFRDFQELWKSEPSLYLARQALKFHLRKHISNKVLCDFQNPWDPMFAKYVKEFCPSFILLSDGNIKKQRSSRPFCFHECTSNVFVCQLAKCLQLGLNCAFTEGIELGTSTLDGYHVESNCVFIPSELLEHKIIDDLRSSNRNSQINVAQKVEDVLSQLNASIPFLKECNDEGDFVDCCFFVHMTAASIYLKSFSGHPYEVGGHLDIVRVVLLHAVLLKELPLKYRALSLGNCDMINEPAVRQNLLQCFMKIQFIVAEVLESLQRLPEPGFLDWSRTRVCDVWDGRLLFMLMSILLIDKRNGEDVSLSAGSSKKFSSLVNGVSCLYEGQIEPFPILCCIEIELLAECLKSMLKSPQSLDHGNVWQSPYSRPVERLASPEPEEEGLIKMECPLLNYYAGEIVDVPSVRKLDLDNPAAAAMAVSGNDFDETYHWHSGKPLSDDYDRTKGNQYGRKDDKATQRNQAKYAVHMQRYGESLAGDMSSKVIVVEEHNERRKKEKSKTSHKSRKIIEENKKKKEEEIEKKEERSWANDRKGVQRLLDQQNYDDALGKIEVFIKRASVEKVIIDGLMMKALICWKKWELACEKKDSQKEIGTSDAEMCFLTIRELVENYGRSLKQKEKVILANYLIGLGFSDIALKEGLIKESAPPGVCSLNLSSSRFQLHYISHQLRREERTDPDPRVDNFIPDTWQRKLLDAVDNKQSALIVAPTSSGKTFASYYCMERVLKEDNEGVLVYVSPTKALVNQVAATCYARYHRKVMPAGKAVYGVFTRDYRHNALNSQILVTVPQCLEILLLSPRRQDWAAKIKYVVFDEVHCIGSEIGAEYWEHLLLLIRSPFLALSATIRNPQDLHKWLQNAEDDKRKRDEENNTLRPNSPTSYEVALVTYSERYSDLEKFDYVTPRAKISPQNDLLGSSHLKHIHPCSMLTVRQLTQSSTFPAHVTLSPRESLALYDAMASAWPEKGAVQRLSPESHFKDTAFISKAEARSYEAELKKEFMNWVVDPNRIQKVIGSLRGDILSTGVRKAKVRQYVVEEFYPLLQELDRNDQLPAIFFSYDRSLCEKLAGWTVKQLCEKEETLRSEAIAKGKAKVNEKLAHQMSKREKRFRDNCEDQEEVMRKTHSTGHKDFHNQRKQISSEKSCFLFENPPNMSCSYAGVGVLDAEDGQVFEQKLRKKGFKGLSSFEEGLRRGVSYHHSGMSAALRSIVEMLFRKKFLRVVFATGTLALGIHMPCKTVIFAGNSVYLNTLQYHQISGRAGRRGFDLKGNVIFLGVPQAKIQRLMTVNLPPIVGNFPLNATLVLRLLLMVNKATNREVAMNQALTLLQNPLICMDQPELDLQLKHHFLFSVQLLVRQGLLDRKGNPQGLAGLATHLHYHEPSNLVLVEFLQGGLFHDFCRNGQSKGGRFSKEFLKSLTVILSHLFARRVKLHDYILLRPHSTSKVQLEDLPPTFKKGLAKYNDRVRGIFDLYLRTVAAHVYETMGEDNTLPLSHLKFISYKKSSNAPISSESGLTVEEKLQSLSLPYKACSAFAALSGNTDNRLYSSEDLMSNIRYQVYTDIKVVPILNDNVTLNAYAVDFFNHGNDKALVSDNGLMRGDVFNLLKDFLMVIKSIHVSLSELAPADGDEVILAFKQLDEEYTNVFNKAFNIHDLT